jgi:hypothetical protein
MAGEPYVLALSPSTLCTLLVRGGRFADLVCVGGIAGSLVSRQLH